MGESKHYENTIIMTIVHALIYIYKDSGVHCQEPCERGRIVHEPPDDVRSE